MTITQAEIDDLRRLIEEAIPGPWHVDGLHVMAGDLWVCTGYHDGNQPGAGISPQPEYIAYANPERITRLLDAHKAQAERTETLETLLRKALIVLEYVVVEAYLHPDEDDVREQIRAALGEES